MNQVEKQATTPEERAKYIKAAIIAGIGAAGIGSVARSVKSKKTREKSMNAEKARNAIVIPIKKSKFLEDLPTPKELAESRGESVDPVQEVQQGQDTQSAGSVGQVQDQASAAAETGAALTPEQIAEKKKAILAGNARKFNYFGKRASVKKAQEKEEKKDDASDSGEKGTDTESSEKNDGDERVLFRDQDGKFVSPTDPIAVAQVEKKAVDGMWDFFAHPFNTLVSNAKAIFGDPVWGTAGALGSIYLAAKISDAINERRRAKSKERLERARDEYVGILEGEEKKADFDLRTTPGAVIGTSFFVPMALTAIVTNKIIENRKLEKKKQKEQSDSYPDEPIILYKTSASQEIPIAPETALALFLVKRAMFLSAEQEARGTGIDKEAFWFEDYIRGSISSGIDKIKHSVENIKPPMNEAEAVDFSTNMMVNPNNNAHLLSMVRGFTKGDENSQRDAFINMLNGLPEKDPNRNRMLFTLANKDMREKVMNGVMRSQVLQNALVDRFQNDQYADTFGKYREELVNNEIQNMFGPNSIKKDGIIYKILSWIANNLGIGKYMAGNKINAMFAQNRAVTPQAMRVDQTSKQAPGAPVTQIEPATKTPS